MPSQARTRRRCARAARELDYDRYLAALLAPRAARDGLMALAAFHGEIARIPRTVREPGVGDIRLQWWRDALRDAGRHGDRQSRRRRDARRGARARAAHRHAHCDDRRLRARARSRRLGDGGGDRRARRGDAGRRVSTSPRRLWASRRPIDRSAAARRWTSRGARAGSARAAGSGEQGAQSVR